MTSCHVKQVITHSTATHWRSVIPWSAMLTVHWSIFKIVNSKESTHALRSTVVSTRVSTVDDPWQVSILQAQSQWHTATISTLSVLNIISNEMELRENSTPCFILCDLLNFDVFEFDCKITLSYGTCHLCRGRRRRRVDVRAQAVASMPASNIRSSF